MIVRDEAHTIIAALESAAPAIASFCIVDTGSQDQTIAMITDWSARTGIPGEVVKDVWVDFGTNRTVALRHAVADQKATHVIFLDADDRMVVDDAFAASQLEIGESYKLRNLLGGMSYRLPQLIAVDALTWESRGPLHEYLVPLNHAPGFSDLDTITIRRNVVAGGQTVGQSQRDKYLRDARTLQEYLVRNPDDARSQYYLGQSYRDAAELEQAICAYEKRIDMAGWDQETYHAMLQVGHCHEQLGQTSDALVAYLDAWKFRKKRRDALYHVIRILRRREDYDVANLFLGLVFDVPASHGDTHFVDAGASDWKLFDEASVVKYWVKDYEASLRLTWKALEYDAWAPEQCLRIEKNAQFSRDALLLREE